MLNVVETPTSPSSALALSRFEFEAGKGNEGTKILMVEWDSSASTPGREASGKGHNQGLSDWEVSWEGKTHVIPTRDSDPGSAATQRVYFLLPVNAPVPPLINITPRSGAGPTLRTKPMPAIFPAGLGAADTDAGKLGVLHTIWATKRLAELEAEIAAEMKANTESVGLEIVVQEREWILERFGVGDTSTPARASLPMVPQSPTSPRSPIGGKLGEKLRSTLR